MMIRAVNPDFLRDLRAAFGAPEHEQKFAVAVLGLITHNAADKLLVFIYHKMVL